MKKLVYGLPYFFFVATDSYVTYFIKVQESCCKELTIQIAKGNLRLGPNCLTSRKETPSKSK